MRPTVEAPGLGLENRHREISGSGCNAKRCNRSKSLYSAVRSDATVNKVSRRDVRTFGRDELPLIRGIWHGFGSVACRPGRAGARPYRLAFRTAGLSLIEMLVVVTIIAAIAALITTSVMSALQQQSARVCQNNMLTIEAAKDEYIRDHPGATSIDENAFAHYFRFGIPKCPDGGTYENLYVLTQQVSCTKHGAIQAFPSATP
jgi:prepilin-type N-terminal cleavage/methylation domain-containing protein